MSAEDSDGQSQVRGDSSFMAHSDVVHSINEDFNPQASSASQNGKQYQTYMSRWLQYYSRKKIDSLSASVRDVIHFLTEQFEARLVYSSLNIARGPLPSLNG